MHHDGFQAQVFDPPPRGGILPLRRASTELGAPSSVLGSFRGLRLAKDGNKEVGGKTTTSPSVAGASGAEPPPDMPASARPDEPSQDTKERVMRQGMRWT